MRLGIFGGTFDPPHNGHLFAIQYALEHAKLDKCLVVVSGDPWMKNNVNVDARTRLTWMKKICENNFDDKVIVDDREVKRSGPTYTIDTLEELTEQYQDSELVLIVGEDIPPTMDKWKDIEKIRGMVEIFIVPREIVNVSSTQVREVLASNGDLKSLIPAEIEREITEKSLYNSDTHIKEE